MLEGAVARLLNHLLGKYVVDLDTENLNVGIFSGQVQLTDLKLKPEALFELGLPVEVRAGTIGKVWLQIPWSALWSRPIVVHIENLLIISAPIVSNSEFDSERNKFLVRAFKRKLLAKLDTESQVIGGPNCFSEHLFTNVLDNLQLNVSNIHVRYEDPISFATPISAGVCIGNITAESTNSKWRSGKTETKSTNNFYLVKIETISTYWNCNAKKTEWNLPAEYYTWKNAMASSLQNFAMNNEQFDFLLKPMTSKIKITITKSKTGNVVKCFTDLVLQDCNVQITKNQFDSILSVSDSLKRMVTSWGFLEQRPKEKILDNPTSWWKYAFRAVLDQRVKPYTWNKIKEVREQYRGYMETYKQIISNPNDTELKLDLQQYEDRLSIVNIVIARQQARLLVLNRSQSEKSFWSMLPSPERTLLCKKIGFHEMQDQLVMDHKYNLRIGNINVSLEKDSKEIMLLTLTQTSISFHPNFLESTYKLQCKIEGLILEGSSEENQLVSIIASEHLPDSSAYFFKLDFEKMPANSKSSYKLHVAIDSVECLYNKVFVDDLNHYFDNEFASVQMLSKRIYKWPKKIQEYIDQKLLDKWDLSFNVKVPYFVIPEKGSFLKAENILVFDLGSYDITTELCQPLEVIENATKMELEEQLYSKLHIECSNMQLLFCHNSDNWKDERKEKDTEIHLLPKSSFSALYARCSKVEKTIPEHKFTINFQTIKLNISERNIGKILKFFTRMEPELIYTKPEKLIQYPEDHITGIITSKHLQLIESKVSIKSSSVMVKRGKIDKNILNQAEKLLESARKENMNEVYAKYVDLPGLEDNISPNNNISVLFRCVVNEFSMVLSRSGDSADRPYLMFRLGVLTMDVALMTYGPAYQLTINSVLLTDKLHTTPSGQYLDLVHSPFPSSIDVITILYRKVSANCPDFWSHFHGVETSLVADFGTLHVLLHQDAIHTMNKYARYLCNKIQSLISSSVTKAVSTTVTWLNSVLHKQSTSPVPPGSVKFSHSARLTDITIRVCDSDFDIVNVQLSGLELDFLFRANERFVFRSYLSNINVEHLSEITLYSKVLSTDEDKVFEMKYVRHASHIGDEMDAKRDDLQTGGSLKFQLGQIHVTVLYKLIVQMYRFVSNLETSPYISYAAEKIHGFVTSITETLKTNKKIHLAINICGPVFLFPQKSSSPNVMIVDSGELNVENFFKEYSNDSVENILIKWVGVTVTRGVMTLVPSLEMQETLIEPLNFNFDIKRYNSIKCAQKMWDIDGALELVQITLGQKDISTILAIFAENIGEGKIINLFPNPVKSPTSSVVIDETVKNLEAFFCEPKQKNIVGKFAIEEITVLLFFDAGELLSSPIRDLNHGLCKFRLTEIGTMLTFYTDGSLDGKLSADCLLIEELGPEANSDDRSILQTPIDDLKNNNCNITINRAPIIDVTFHQNKTDDKSIDIIIGRLSLSLSVPLCERVALFILDCLPKDNLDFGIINHGYECDSQAELIENQNLSSLTISLRVNKPEFIFLVETTSNKKRYFITHTEILSDYSRHGTRLNWVISLSGLHSLFYDLGLNPSAPYVILKNCDLEFSKCNSDEKGKKIIASISGIYVQICSRVVHSLTDIFNDVAEHFKVPESELKRLETKLNLHKLAEPEDLWEPKKLEDIPNLKERVEVNQVIKKDGTNLHEIMLVPKFDAVVIFEIENAPVLLVKSTFEVTIYDWSSLLNSTFECTIQGNYFNENIQSWEPFIDPVVLDEQEYKAWDLLIKVFQDKSLPMLGSLDNKRGASFRSRKTPTTTEDEDSGEDMMYLEPLNQLPNRHNRRVKTSLSTFLDDSDSENEDGTMEKLAAAISDLFTGDWNESEDSDYLHSSENDDDSCDDSIKIKQEDKPHYGSFLKSVYVLVEAKENLNVTITPTFLSLLNDLFTVYSNKTLSVVPIQKTIQVTNDIGPQSKIELFEKRKDEVDAILCVKTFENIESAPGSPVKNNYIVDFCEDLCEEKESNCDEYQKTDNENYYDFATMTSLHFPRDSTDQLYDKINSHYLRVYVPNCQAVQTNCPKKKWQKLMRLHSTIPSQPYYLVASHSIGKTGRSILLSSPLQIKNETCYALNVLYQPSVLQQLNLEPVGDVTNPFETTMRIAVLEAHETYNVPLYIAYHCPIFIQPAFAEGLSASETGIWWRDLATELDIAQNLHCRPRSNTNLEEFSLRVMLTKNLDVSNNLIHAIPNYIIHLLPPLIFYNYLPYSLEIENVGLQQQVKIEPGEKKSIYTLNLSKDMKLQVTVKYNLINWTGALNFTTYLDEKVVVLSSETKEVKHLAINVKADREGSCHLFFYTPYWIVNKTGLPLHIKASATNTVHESTNEDILLFTYKRHGKQTLNVKVYDSNWSNEFGLECAETTGLIVCKDHERKKKYLFLLSIKLSVMCPKLIKIVTILPSFVVQNETTKNLRFMESNEKTDLWIDIAPGQNVTFWPETSTMQMYVKFRDSKLISQAFNIATINRTVLRMDKGYALTVDVTGGVTDSFKVSFVEYQTGDAPILVKNYCADLFLKIQQQEQSQVSLLSPYNMMLYTWDDPTKSRKLVWNVYNNKGSGFMIDILQDSHGAEKIKFHSVSSNTTAVPVVASSSEDSDSSDSVKTTLNKKVRHDKIVIYWLCYREGAQRVLLFTQENRIYAKVMKQYFSEHCYAELLVSLSGVGLSLFTTEQSTKEHIYGALVDAPAIWEVNVGHKWKTLTLELASWIEDKYKLHYKKCQLRDYVHIDFEKMYMLKPFFAELKRTYTPAVYVQLRKSQNYCQFNLKLNSFQVDDKVCNTIIAYPLPSASGVKPNTSFLDVNVLKGSFESCDVYRHIKINVRNFYLNVENYLFGEIRELLTQYKKFNDKIVHSYVKDINSIQDVTVNKIKPKTRKCVIEYLNVSNFEIQLYILNKGQVNISSNNLPICKILDYLFPINLSPYMPTEGVLHKITSIDYLNITEPLQITLQKVYQQVISQFLQQYYSHVLGLQVLVNSFAIQPSIHYPQTDLDKMSNTILYGSRCLLSHVNMSPAALEQCVIDIFANQSLENIQRIRRHGSYHKTEIVPKIITSSARNFNCGVPNALNQLIVKKQNAGVNCDSETFFRTTGKALYSLITRHPDDKSDSVEVAIEAIRRASLLGEPIQIQLRLTRYYNKYQGLKPFSVYESMGQFLFETVGNSRFINDVYWSHVAIDRLGKSILLVSLQHVIKINKCRLWAPWEVEWAIELDEITSLPKITSTELVFNLRQTENSKGETFKVSGEKEMLAWIHEKIEQAIIVSIEDKSWTVTDPQ